MAPDTFIGIVAGLVLSVCTALVSFLFATDALHTELELALVVALVVWLSVCGSIALLRYRRDRRIPRTTLIAIERLIEELGAGDEVTRPDYS